jgi:hypothetical protein
MTDSRNSIKAMRPEPAPERPRGREDRPPRARALYAATLTAALLLLLASAARAVPAANQAAQTEAAPQSASPPAGAAAEPLLREYKGVTLGMSAKDARAKLGKPEEEGEAMDFFAFSEKERARVYYQDGKVSAIIATYIGKDGGAPSPAAVLGAEIEAKPDGSLYKMVTYPRAGYWVAYSRTPGDSPMVMITMRKMP